jgi:hypothetical protein
MPPRPPTTSRGLSPTPAGPPLLRHAVLAAALGVVGCSDDPAPSDAGIVQDVPQDTGPDVQGHDAPPPMPPPVDAGPPVDATVTPMVDVPPPMPPPVDAGDPVDVPITPMPPPMPPPRDAGVIPPMPPPEDAGVIPPMPPPMPPPRDAGQK